jgi:Fe-S-cluster formation regulator IscX/YfhJ
VKSQLVTDNS